MTSVHRPIPTSIVQRTHSYSTSIIQRTNTQSCRQSNKKLTSKVSPSIPPHLQLVFHFNARSILPKMSELSTITKSLKPAIVAVTETWLTTSVPDGTLLLPDYSTVVRADRSSISQRGGGVLLLVHDSLQITVRSDLQIWPESAWLEFQTKTNRSLILGCMYRPPASNANSFAQDLEASLEKVDLRCSDVLIVGDFNAKSQSWLPTDSGNAAGHVLEPAFLRLGLHQCVSSPTHLLPDGSLGALLDLVLTSNPSLISSVSTHPPVGSSDHLSLLCQLQLTTPRTERSTCKRIWNYDKADLAKLTKALSEADWTGVSCSPDINTALSSWTTTFMNIVNKHIPSKRLRKITPKNPFVTPIIEAAIKEKRAALRRLKREPSTTNRDTFKQLRNRVTHLLRKSERAHATSLYRASKLQHSPSNSKNFWSHMKTIQGKVKQTVIPVLVDRNKKATTAGEKAKLLNEFFSEQTKLDGALSSIPDVSSLNNNSRTFDTLHTTPQEVYNILSHLNVRKSSGIDEIPPRLLRECATGISESLSTVFNRSFTSARFPTAWKQALVIPIFKRGDKSSPGNYRPISLLPILSKVLERIVNNKLSRFLASWMAPNQSGFKRSDGTTSQLMRLTQEWSNAVDKGNYVGTIFFDLRKAFDRIWHQGLLAKLAAAGVKGSAHRWFASYLADRQQATVVDGTTSPFAALYAGVPQGAVLSPLLFSVYMNDIPFSGSTNLFADDTSSYVTESSPLELRRKLQDRTEALCTWFTKWLLTINPTKSVVMVFRSYKKPRISIQITVESSIIPQQRTHRHLGVIFNENLTWADHVTGVILNASAKLGLIRRMSKRLDPLVIRELYICCIRPAVEYAHIVWAGLTALDCARLERLNRKAGRLILKLPAASNLPHDILLARAGLPTLTERRQFAQIKFCFNALYRDSRLPEHLKQAVSVWTSSQTPSSHHMTLRGGSVRLPRPWTNCQKSSPFYSAFSLWNTLPSNVQTSASLTTVSYSFS